MEKHSGGNTGTRHGHEFIPARFVEYSAELNMAERKSIVD